MSLAREVEAASGQLTSRLLAANSNYSLQSRRYSFDVPERNGRGSVRTLVSYTVRISREKGWRWPIYSDSVCPRPGHNVRFDLRTPLSDVDANWTHTRTTNECQI